MKAKIHKPSVVILNLWWGPILAVSLDSPVPFYFYIIHMKYIVTLNHGPRSPEPKLYWLIGKSSFSMLWDAHNLDTYSLYSQFLPVFLVFLHSQVGLNLNNKLYIHPTHKKPHPKSLCLQVRIKFLVPRGVMMSKELYLVGLDGDKAYLTSKGMA